VGDWPSNRSLPAVGNRAGLRRARRVLALYLSLLFVVFLGMVLLTVTSRYEGVRENILVYVLLTVIATASAISGYLLTVGRAPWAVYAEEGTLVIRERFGAVRRIPIDATLAIRYLRRSPESVLSPEATETVRVFSYRMKPREYVVADGFFATLPELAAALAVR
jgi:hypothetical protein